jgi:hypothetical protein
MASPAATLRATTLAAPSTGATAAPISWARGEEPCRTAVGYRCTYPDSSWRCASQSLYTRAPDIGGKEAREQMAARASPRWLTPWGTRPGWRVTAVPPFSPPYTLIEPVQVLTAHGSLSWVGGRMCAPPATPRPRVPPSPLRGSAAVESSPPLHWGRAAPGLGVAPLRQPQRAKQGHASPPPERAASRKQRGRAPTDPQRARRPGRPRRLLPQAWPMAYRDRVIDEAEVKEADLVLGPPGLEYRH